MAAAVWAIVSLELSESFLAEPRAHRAGEFLFSVGSAAKGSLGSESAKNALPVDTAADTIHHRNGALRMASFVAAKKKLQEVHWGARKRSPL